MKKIFLSVVISCYNEEANIKRGVLNQMADYLKKQKYNWEVIITDDESTDNSLELLIDYAKKNQGFRILKIKHRGKAGGIQRGLKAAKGDYVLFTDIDQSTPIKELEKLLPWLKKGFSVVIGSRGMERKNFPLFRKVGAVAFLTFRKLLLLPEINDTQCGFKLFERKLVSEVFPRLAVLQKKATGWTVTSYDVELLFMVSKKGAKIKEVVVDWADRDTSLSKGKSYLGRYFKESKDMLKQVIGVKINDWQGRYEEKNKNNKL